MRKTNKRKEAILSVEYKEKLRNQKSLSKKIQGGEK